MPNLPESATWEIGIRQLETTDRVLAGAGGVMNTAQEQLGNRTAYLKNRVDSLESYSVNVFTNLDATPNVHMTGAHKTANSAPTSIIQFEISGANPLIGDNGRMITIKAGDNNTTIVHDPTKIICASGGNNLLILGEIVRFQIMETGIWTEIPGEPLAVSVLPTAVEGYRHKKLFVRGGVGVSDQLYIGYKNSLDAFDWAPVLPV